MLKKTSPDEALVSVWVRMYLTGMSGPEIAKLYGVHTLKVYYWLKKARTEIRTRYRTQPPAPEIAKRNVEIVERLSTGTETLEAVAKDYGITRERARQIRARAGVTTTTKRKLTEAERRKNRALWWTRRKRWLVCPDCKADLSRISSTDHRAQTGCLSALEVQARARDEAIIADYLAGMRNVEISLKHTTAGGRPITYGHLYRVLKRHGITPNRGGGRYVRTEVVMQRRREYRLAKELGFKRVGPATSGWRATDG